MWLKQSTAVTVKMGPFLDSTDGNTTEEALAIAQADIRLSKNGGAFAQTNNAAGAAHDEVGWYGVPLDTTDTNTLGRLKVAIHEAGALAVWAEFMVVSANTWDSFFAAENLDVNTVEISGDSAAADNAELAFDGTGYGFGNCTMPTTTAVTNRVTANTDQIEGGDATDAINAACDASIETYNLDHLLSLACPGNVITGAVVDNSVMAILAAIGGDISDYDDTTDSLEALAVAIAAITLTADLVWDEEMDANAPAACNTAREYMNVMVAALAAISAGTGDWSARDLGDTKTRIQATLTAAGARSSVDTLDGT